MSEIRVTSVLGENGSDPVGLSTGFTVGPTSGTTATITHEGQASFTGIVTATTFVPTVGQLSHRNIIINGAMNVSQRATSFATVASGTYTLDRMRYHENIDSGVVTITQESVTDLPSFAKAIKINCTTAETGVPAKAGSKFVALSHFLEGQDLQQLAYGTSSAKQITLSFYVKSNITGTFCVSIYKPDQTARNVSLGYTINSANTWERKTLTFPADTGGGGIDNDNGSGLQFYFVLARQQGYQGTASTTWGNNTDARFANLCTATIFENTNDHIMFTGVQLEVGPVATPFEHRSYGDELSRCQRYYQRQAGSSDAYIQPGKGQGTTAIDAGYALAVPLRAEPTVACASNRVFKHNGFSNSTTAPSVIHWSATNSPYSSVIALRFSGHSSITSNYVCAWCPTFGSVLTLDAEL